MRTHLRFFSREASKGFASGDVEKGANENENEDRTKGAELNAARHADAFAPTAVVLRCVASSFEGFDSTRLDIIRLLCVRQAYRDAVESAALYCALAALLLLLVDHLA